MRRRVHVEVGSITVDAALGARPAALQAAIERAITRRLQEPGAVEGLHASQTPRLKVRAETGADITESVASAMGAAVAGDRQ
jgi:hypothetical protein